MWPETGSKSPIPWGIRAFAGGKAHDAL